MSLTFTKLFSSITESTIWCEDSDTRIVWVTMLAMADRKGRVWASIPGLANRARVSLEATEKALGRFLAPDKYSRTPDHDGRRIEPIDGGWLLLNHEKYRAMRDEEEKRIKDAERQRRHRESVTRMRDSHTKSQEVAQAEAEAEADLSIPNGIEGAKDAPTDCPHKEIIALYHEILPMCPKVEVWNKTRAGYLRQRWKESPSLEEWRAYFEHVSQSKFLTGRVNGSKERPPFVASLEWLIRPENFANVIEGKYHRGK